NKKNKNKNKNKKKKKKKNNKDDIVVESKDNSYDKQDVKLDNAHDGGQLFPKEEFIVMSDEKLGRGASAIVIKAFHVVSCRVAAIKTARSTHKNIQHQTNQEINVLQKMNSSKYIINMIRHGKDCETNATKIALEYMDGGSLKDYIQSHSHRPCMEGIVKYVSFSVLQGLKQLHEQNYVHNDVKPGNILYNMAGDVKLSDFGTVMELHPDCPGLDMLTVNCGTAKYVAPEKAQATQIRYGAKADIWSFGLAIFELCTGQLIHSDTPSTQLYFHPPQLDALVFSKDCCDFIRSCLIQ
ncbi:hypothetical protein RFI_38561, partial [Reticulomyxa filosa]